MRTIVLLLSLVAAVSWQGCALSFDHWKGKRQSQLTASWGSPTKTLTNPKGGKVLVYDRSPWETDVNYLGNPTTPTRRIGFYVNTKGIIHDWKEIPVGKTLYK